MQIDSIVENFTLCGIGAKAHFRTSLGGVIIFKETHCYVVVDSIVF